MHESNFHVTGFSYGSNIRDAVGKVSCSRAASNVAATACSRPSRPKFQYSSPTFQIGILAAIVDTSNWRASPAMGNASMDDTDTAAIATFFFTTGKSFVILSIVPSVI
jgi:hypothetical protein